MDKGKIMYEAFFSFLSAGVYPDVDKLENCVDRFIEKMKTLVQQEGVKCPKCGADVQVTRIHENKYKVFCSCHRASGATESDAYGNYISTRDKKDD